MEFITVFCQIHFFLKHRVWCYISLWSWCFCLHLNPSGSTLLPCVLSSSHRPHWAIHPHFPRYPQPGPICTAWPMFRHLWQNMSQSGCCSLTPAYGLDFINTLAYINEPGSCRALWLRYGIKPLYIVKRDSVLPSTTAWGMRNPPESNSEQG